MANTRKRKASAPTTPPAQPEQQVDGPVASTSSSAELETSLPPSKSKRAKTVPPTTTATGPSTRTKGPGRQVRNHRKRAARKNEPADPAADTEASGEGGFVFQAPADGAPTARTTEAAAGGGMDEDINDTPNTTPDHIDLGEDESSTVMAGSVVMLDEDKKDKGKSKQEAAGGGGGRVAAMQEDIKQSKEENRLLKEQIAAQDKALLLHREFVQAMHSALSCGICLDPVDTPYALACGHIFCHKDVYGWFHRTDVDAPAPGRRGIRRGPRLGPAVHNEAQHDAQPPPPQTMSSAMRLRNLVCPSCRFPCATSPPAQLYALKSVTEALRDVEHNPAIRPALSLTPGPQSHHHPHPHPAAAEVHGAEAHRDPKDKTWGGLWDETGKEPVRPEDRRVVVHDHADGVRRCGECNWEIQADGICNGCGRIYDPSDDSDSLVDGSDGMSHSEDGGTRYATSELEDELGSSDAEAGSDAAEDDDAEDLVVAEVLRLADQEARRALRAAQREADRDMREARRQAERDVRRAARDRDPAARNVERGDQRRGRAVSPAPPADGAPVARRASGGGSTSEDEDEDEEDEAEDFFVRQLYADDEGSASDWVEEDDDDDGFVVPDDHGLAGEEEEMSDPSDDEEAAAAERNRIRHAGASRRRRQVTPPPSTSGDEDDGEEDPAAAGTRQREREQYGDDDFVSRPRRRVVPQSSTSGEEEGDSDQDGYASSARGHASGSDVAEEDVGEEAPQPPARGGRRGWARRYVEPSSSD